jgi:predicted transposase/invertase (TIGR01784 family)
MRRDSIFYKLFKQFPGLLFEFIERPPPEGDRYRFDSIAVKETQFAIDGVFIPPDDTTPRIVYFAEVQFQKDDSLYDRFFAEISLFLRRAESPYDDWQGVLIFGSRNLEPDNIYLHRSLLQGEQLKRIYLDELDTDQSYPIGIQLMQLTILSEAEALPTALTLVDQAKATSTSYLSQRDILDLITTIMVYKYKNYSRKELETMLGLDLEEPRAIREMKEEGFRQGLEEGRQEGRQEGERSLALRQLTRKFGVLQDPIVSTINTLSLEQLDSLGEALLDFTTLSDLETWLANHSS